MSFLCIIIYFIYFYLYNELQLLENTDYYFSNFIIKMNIIIKNNNKKNEFEL